MENAPDYTQAMQRLLHDVQPHELLWIGPPLAALHPPENMTTLAPEDVSEWLASNARHDYAIVHQALDALPRITAENLLARLRDLHGNRFAVLIEQPSDWSDNQLFAFGLRKLATGDGWRLFAYDIADYKHTPDWLNPKYWAHPERWNAERW